MDTLDLLVPGTSVGQRLDTFWHAYLADEVARTSIQDWIRDGRASVNGQVCRKPSARVTPGQRVSLTPQQHAAALIPQAGPLTVLFADAHLAVLNKQAGLTVHPAPSVSGPTLLHYAAHTFPALLTMSGDRPGIVHRLDKDTTGLMLLALNEPTRLALTHAFAERLVRKEYLALVTGEPPAAGSCDLPIGRHPTIKTRMAVARAGGRPAATDFTRLWTAPDRSASLVLVRIHTGRTHQVRVHMTALGHPLLGDTVYADPATAARAPRQMLHAWRLRLEHPHTEEPLFFEAPLPEDFGFQLSALCATPLRVVLTGVSGCGKSTVRRLLEQDGVPVFCADSAVAQAYQPGRDGWQILRHHFGTTFVPSASQPVDKTALYAAMHNSDSMRREIERLIHPVVRDAVRAFQRMHGAQLSVTEIPLACEAGLQTDHDLLVTVFRPDQLRHAHLAARGWNAARIAQVDAWQWDQRAKVRAAHIVLDNSGTLDDLARRVRALARVLRDIHARRQQRHLRAALTQLYEPESSEESP